MRLGGSSVGKRLPDMPRSSRGRIGALGGGDSTRASTTDPIACSSTNGAASFATTFTAATAEQHSCLSRGLCVCAGISSIGAPTTSAISSARGRGNGYRHLRAARRAVFVCVAKKDVCSCLHISREPERSAGISPSARASIGEVHRDCGIASDGRPAGAGEGRLCCRKPLTCGSARTACPDHVQCGR